jgi:hypothetical protein
MVFLGSLWPIYTDRYVLVAAPGLALVVGLGVSACWYAFADERRESRGTVWLGRGGALALLAALLLAPSPQLRAYHTEPTYWREDFRRAAAYVEEKAAARDAVILLGSSQPIMHYYRGEARALPFPQRGDSVQGEEEVVSLLSAYVEPGASVRLVMYSWETVDPQGLIEGQLRARCEFRGEHWQRETGQRPIRVMNFVACDDHFALEPRRSLDAVWADQVALSAIRLVDVAPGSRARVVLWWHTLRRPDRDYSAFVHLVDASGQIVAQFDKLPLNPFYPMRAWPPRTDQRDVYPLKVPEDADLDGAWLAIGLYNARNGRRLAVRVGEQPVGDHLQLPLSSLRGEQ